MTDETHFTVQATKGQYPGMIDSKEMGSFTDSITATATPKSTAYKSSGVFIAGCLVMV